MLQTVERFGWPWHGLISQPRDESAPAVVTLPGTLLTKPVSTASANNTALFDMGLPDQQAAEEIALQGGSWWGRAIVRWPEVVTGQPEAPTWHAGGPNRGFPLWDMVDGKPKLLGFCMQLAVEQLVGNPGRVSWTWRAAHADVNAPGSSYTQVAEIGQGDAQPNMLLTTTDGNGERLYWLKPVTPGAGYASGGVFSRVLDIYRNRLLVGIFGFVNDMCERWDEGENLETTGYPRQLCGLVEVTMNGPAVSVDILMDRAAAIGNCTHDQQVTGGVQYYKFPDLVVEQQGGIPPACIQTITTGSSSPQQTTAAGGPIRVDNGKTTATASCVGALLMACYDASGNVQKLLYDRDDTSEQGAEAAMTSSGEYRKVESYAYREDGVCVPAGTTTTDSRLVVVETRSFLNLSTRIRVYREGGEDEQENSLEYRFTLLNNQQYGAPAAQLPFSHNRQMKVDGVVVHEYDYPSVDPNIPRPGLESWTPTMLPGDRQMLASIGITVADWDPLVNVEGHQCEVRLLRLSNKLAAVGIADQPAVLGFIPDESDMSLWARGLWTPDSYEQSETTGSVHVSLSSALLGHFGFSFPGAAGWAKGSYNPVTGQVVRHSSSEWQTWV